MAKAKTVFVCNECGYESPKWLGKCPACNSWNTFFEQKVVETKSTVTGKAVKERAVPQVLDEVVGKNESRIDTGIGELNRVLGGGLVNGSLVLLGGEPGIGKSTLILELCDKITGTGKVLYVSGEESAEQVKLRADRLGIKNNNITFLGETDIDVIEETILAMNPKLVIIDSIQTMYSEEITSAAGTVSQVREITSRIMRVSKGHQITTIIIGHVTKDGNIAGPRVLEHMVDTVLYFEGDPESNYRILRACKNRFGSVNEIGVFGMTDKGLRGVRNPSALFLAERREGVAGSVTFINLEGTRPILIEIQALVDKSMLPNPKRLTVGTDAQRLTMLLAILHRHVTFSTYDQDVFLNAVGGIKINETASDLAVLIAIVSSMTNQAVSSKTAIFGEVGLGGEIRPVSRGQERIKEASKLGFKRIIVPLKNKASDIPDVEIIGVDNLRDAVKLVFGSNRVKNDEQIYPDE